MQCGGVLVDGDPPSARSLGIVLGVLASIGINIGNNLQAVALQAQKAAAAQQGERRQPLLWHLGTAIFLAAALLNFSAFMFAPASILAPLESVQFVTNLLFSRLYKKIAITSRSLLAHSAIVAGTVIAVVFGPNEVIRMSQLEVHEPRAPTQTALPRLACLHASCPYA